MPSRRNPAQRPAKPSNSSGLPSVTRPDRFMNPTPVGTSVGNARRIGRASEADNSTIRTGWARRPRVTVACSAARTLATQSAPGNPATTYCLPLTVIGVTGVDRSRPDLRPCTVSTTGLSPPKLIPSRDIWMKTLFAGFSHQGGLIRSLSPMAATLPASPGLLWAPPASAECHDDDTSAGQSRGRLGIQRGEPPMSDLPVVKLMADYCAI